MSKELHGKSIYLHSTKRIGKGAFSKVYKGFNIETDVVVAVKAIEKDTILEKLQKRLKSEIKLHSELNHKNIIKLYDFIEDSEYYYFVLEYCSDGDLHQYIKKNKTILEPTAQSYTRQLADGLEYLRSKNIVHRDLKPHNILLCENHTVIKITDFNFARELWDKQLAETLCGSPLYMAPEIIETNMYTNKSDLWSVGMIIYEMLHGFTPYDDAINPMDLLHKIKKRRIEYGQRITMISVDLLGRLLTINHEKRIDWEEFFNHPWLKQSESDDLDTDEEIFDVVGGELKNMNLSDRYDFNIITDYNPSPSKPIEIEFRKESVSVNSNSNTSSSVRSPTSSKSLPTTFTRNIVGYMTSSVGCIMRGTFNYLNQ